MLKYKILEYCVNAIFDGIYKNLFSKCVNKRIHSGDLCEGMVLSQIYSSRWGIERDRGNSVFLNCTIYSIIPEGTKYNKIRFGYTEGPSMAEISVNLDGSDYWVFIL